MLRRVKRIPRKLGYFWGPRLMSALRRRWLLFRHPHANIVFEGPVYLGPGFTVWIPDEGSLIVGAGVEFRRGVHIEISGDGVIRVGARTVFTHSALIQCSTEIEIGEDCGLGQALFMADGNHSFDDPSKPMHHQGYNFKPIKIGRGASIFSKVTILDNVGERALVAAHAVVTKPVPPYTLAVGAPAKPIRYFGPPGEEPPELKPESKRVATPAPNAD